ncbi:hypothetical protein HANVADRAFT_27475, partial [Hanseniaspora valbyensis NRRL Y-1626]
KQGINQYVAHPRYFTSNHSYKFLNVFTFLGMLSIFYVARFLGSPWHNISGYKAANAIVNCATSDESLLDPEIKYGSATTRIGKEYLVYDKSIEHSEKEMKLIRDYFENLRNEWDLKLKDQIKDTRQL